jgi:hypothetical protein
MPVFVVDSNFFINAHRDTYPLDVAHSFWNKVKTLAADGRIISIDKVKEEIYSYNEDELQTWCSDNLDSSFFRDSGSVLSSTYPNVLQWASSRTPQYLQGALNEFMAADKADAFLIAYALTDSANLTITTLEVSAPQGINRVKIPDACSGLGINSCNTISMFRQLGETF